VNASPLRAAASKSARKTSAWAALRKVLRQGRWAVFQRPGSHSPTAQTLHGRQHLTMPRAVHVVRLDQVQDLLLPCRIQ